MDLYFSKIINERKPIRHYDIGSRVDGFISQLFSAGRNVILLDIRPFPIKIDNLEFHQVDATSLSGIEDGSIESISSLHAIEHFGLGRYGDDIDPYAWKKALLSIQNKLMPGGYFYFAVPVANRDIVYFNAHRVFSQTTITKVLDELKLERFAYISDYMINEVECGDDSMREILGKLKDYDCGLF